MKSALTWAVVVALLGACGGSKEPAKEADDFEEEKVSDEQHRNEVDPFFEGESRHGPKNVDLSEDEDEESEDE